MPNSDLKIRRPRFADDLWYSSTPSKLEAEVQNYMAAAPFGPKSAEVVGLIAPHAGYFYSGHVAGATFAGLTPGVFATVVLIGPDHRGASPGGISTPQVDIWRTPLGDIPVDWDALQAIKAEIPVALLSSDEEHSLEVELPFLQATLRQFKLIPLMMGDQSPDTCRSLGAAIVKAIQTQSSTPIGGSEGGGVLLVASSDLSHYFDDDNARRLDQATLQFILNLDADGLIEHVKAGRRQGQPFACGAGPIATIIHAAMALGATQATLIKYATSADVHPHKDQVVGYAAVAISKEISTVQE